MIIHLDDKERKTQIEWEDENGKTQEMDAIILFQFDEIADYTFMFYLIPSVNQITVFKMEADGENMTALEDDEIEQLNDVLNDFIEENEFYEDGKKIDIYEKLNKSLENVEETSEN